ncbi:MAG: aspartate kinase [Clostridiales bacterium]|jgi:aspartate kinase|nr:aspartate kinase [Clostridiales bacterium]
MLIALKFGGSSLADAARFKRVKEIADSNPARRAMAVSAPGKAAPGGSKVTDLLYLCHAHIKYGADYRPTLYEAERRFSAMADELKLDADTAGWFAEIRERVERRPDEDFLVSRGEYICARLAAAFLGWDFVDAAGAVFFSYDGSVDTERTYEAIRRAYAASSGRIVVPGFYGAMPDGEIKLMSRGGSDITGALLAAALDADLYENWTDVPVLLMADPSIVNNPRSIPQITYNELRALTYMGARVLHDESVFPARQKNIPINIRSVREPDDPGTMISDDFGADTGGHAEDVPGFITGLAGKKGFSIITIHRDDISGNIGVIREVLELFERRRIKIEGIPSGIDGFSLIVSTEAVKPMLYALLADIEKLCGPGSASVTGGIALIAVVGRKMVESPGISGKLFGALGKNGVNIRLINQDVNELRITVGVSDKDFEKAISVLYESFTGG